MAVGVDRPCRLIASGGAQHGNPALCGGRVGARGAPPWPHRQNRWDGQAARAHRGPLGGRLIITCRGVARCLRNCIDQRHTGPARIELDVQRDSTHDATIKLPPLPTTTSARADTTTTGKVVPLPQSVDDGSDTGSSRTDIVGTTPTPVNRRMERASGNAFKALRLSDNRDENDEGDDDAAMMESTSLDRLVEAAEDEVLGTAFDGSSGAGEIKPSLAFEIFCMMSGCGPCPSWWPARVHTATWFTGAVAAGIVDCANLVVPIQGHTVGLVEGPRAGHNRVRAVGTPRLRLGDHCLENYLRPCHPPSLIRGL